MAPPYCINFMRKSSAAWCSILGFTSFISDSTNFCEAGSVPAVAYLGRRASSLAAGLMRRMFGLCARKRESGKMSSELFFAFDACHRMGTCQAT